MKKYLFIMMLWNMNTFHAIYAEKYTVQDLYGFYKQTKSGTIITEEMRTDLPYYKKMMSDYVATFERQNLMASQEKLKGAIAVIATLHLIRIGTTIDACFLGGIIFLPVFDYFKDAYMYKKNVSFQYDTGKKILAQLEKAEETEKMAGRA